jgi:hypothetical protein
VTDCEDAPHDGAPGDDADDEDPGRGVTRLFHTTDSAERIFAEGFRDGGGWYLAGLNLRGVLLARWPAYVDEAGPRDTGCFELTLPADVDLGEYAIVEVGRPVTEWCVPAELLNRRAGGRLLDEAEVGALPAIVHLADGPGSPEP